MQNLPPAGIMAVFNNWEPPLAAMQNLLPAAVTDILNNWEPPSATTQDLPAAATTAILNWEPPFATMQNLPPATITAILNDWDVPTYDGSQDARQWLKTIEERCQTYGVPPTQMTEIAVRCTTEQANLVLKAIFETKVDEAGVWPWEDFKRCVIQIEANYRQNMGDAPQNVEDGDPNSQHPYVKAALAVTLIGVGSLAVLPAATVGILGAIGISSGGVAAGSAAAFLQSVIYGGATGGVFSVLQSFAATTVVSPLLTLAGLGSVAAGGWFGSGGGARGEGPPAAET